MSSNRAWTPVAGVDGCPAGWVVATLAADGALALRLVSRFVDVLAGPHALVAVDMPIGLFEEGRARLRACDLEARARLPGKTSSVFAPPTRAALRAARFEETRGTGLSIQAFHLGPKIREVDAALTPALQARVFESHPELAFAAMNGGAPALEKKRSREGKRKRRALLRATGAFPSLARDVDGFLAGTRRRDVREDDVLDACALAWVAREAARSGARRVVPGDAPRDARGLRMEIAW